MKIWVDAQLSPAIAAWINRSFADIQATSVRALGLLWITCGNTSNARMREILAPSLPKVIALLVEGEPLVEISDQ